MEGLPAERFVKRNKLVFRTIQMNGDQTRLWQVRLEAQMLNYQGSVKFTAPYVASCGRVVSCGDNRNQTGDEY
jgi:hypothetical protein